MAATIRFNALNKSWSPKDYYEILMFIPLLYHTLLYPTIPYYTILYHAIPCIPYHTIPYQEDPDVYGVQRVLFEAAEVRYDSTPGCPALLGGAPTLDRVVNLSIYICLSISITISMSTSMSIHAYIHIYLSGSIRETSRKLRPFATSARKPSTAAGTPSGKLLRDGGPYVALII